jgi:hypothetical protein
MYLFDLCPSQEDGTDMAMQNCSTTQIQGSYCPRKIQGSSKFQQYNSIALNAAA